MDILRVYAPHECDEHGVPLDWERCQTCGGTGTKRPRGFAPSGDRFEDAELATWPCLTCGGHGSLKSAAIARLDFAFNPNDDPLGAGIRCMRCSHPMSDGTWEGPAAEGPGLDQVSADQMVADWLAQQANPNHICYNATFWSPCDEGCRHQGPMRWSDGRMVPLGAGADAALIGAGDRDGIVEASWRQVDIRTLSWPHDLRPEQLAILCTRCYAEKLNEVVL